MKTWIQFLQTPQRDKVLGTDVILAHNDEDLFKPTVTMSGWVMITFFDLF